MKCRVFLLGVHAPFRSIEVDIKLTAESTIEHARCISSEDICRKVCWATAGSDNEARAGDIVQWTDPNSHEQEFAVILVGGGIRLRNDEAREILMEKVNTDVPTVAGLETFRCLARSGIDPIGSLGVRHRYLAAIYLADVLLDGKNVRKWCEKNGVEVEEFVTLQSELQRIFKLIERK